MNDPRHDLAREVARAGLNVAPGATASAYAIVTGAMPLVIGFLTIVLLVLQILYARRKLRSKLGPSE